MVAKKNIVWFEEVHKDDVGLVGGKGANLGEMTNAASDPRTDSYSHLMRIFEFIDHNGLAPKIKKF